MCRSSALHRSTDLWPWRKKASRHATARCPASPRGTNDQGTALTSSPNACRTRPLPLVVRLASPVTWPTWVTCPPSATRDTCCQRPRPFTLHSVTPTTPIARRSGLSLTEAFSDPEPPLACRSHHIAINTKWPPESRQLSSLVSCTVVVGKRLSVGLDDLWLRHGWLHWWAAAESET